MSQDIPCRPEQFQSSRKSSWHVELSKANLSGANIQNSDLRKVDLSHTIFNDADITGTKLHGTIRDHWQIEGIKCRYIYVDIEGKERTPKNRDFTEGEFEKKYLWMEKVTDIVLELPYSSMMHHLGMLIQNFVNREGSEDQTNAIFLKGIEALGNQTTQIKYIVFGDDENFNEIHNKLDRAQKILNAHSKELRKISEDVEKSDDIIDWKEGIGLPVLPVEVKPKNIEKSLNRMYTKLPLFLQKAVEILQQTIK